METKSKNKLGLMLAEKCPNCGVGNVFQKPKHIFDVVPKMKSNCENCNYHYEREPGFYQGAMFVSYGLGLFQAIVVFFILKLAFPDLDVINVLIVIIGAIILFSMKNFKLSRMIWLYLLPK